MRVPYPEELFDFDLPVSREDRNRLPAVEGERLSLDDVAYWLDVLQRRIGSLNSQDRGSIESRLRSAERGLTAIAPSTTNRVLYWSGSRIETLDDFRVIGNRFVVGEELDTMYYPNAGVVAGYESNRRLDVQGGLNILPDPVSGYANLNILYNRNIVPPDGIGTFNFAEYIATGPNAGKFIKRYSIGIDNVQPLATSEMGDLLNPMFVLFNMTDVDLSDSTSYDMLNIQTYDQVVSGHTLYAGQWGFNGWPANGSVFFFTPLTTHQPTSLYVMAIDDGDAGHPFLRFTRGNTGWNRFTADNLATFRWYGDSGEYDPSSGYGYQFRLDGSARSNMEFTGNTLTVVNLGGGTTFASGTDYFFNLTCGYATGDKSIFMGFFPAGAGGTFLRAGTGSLSVGTESNAPFYVRTGDVDRLVVDSNGNLGLGTTSPQDIFHISRSEGDVRIRIDSGKSYYSFLTFDDGDDAWSVGKQNSSAPSFLLFHNSSLYVSVNQYGTMGIHVGGLEVNGVISTGSWGEYRVGTTKVVGARQAAISNPTGGTTVDTESRSAIGEILTVMRTHGLIES